MKTIDLIIKNGYIVTIDERMNIFKNASIVINDGSILEIGEEIDLTRYRANEVIDAQNKIVMPGLINSHTHIPMTYFKGLADDLPLDKWLQNHIWPMEAKFLSEEFVYNASMHGISELLKNGVTCFNDMYFWGNKTAEAAIKLGSRAVIGEGVLDFPVANYTNPQQMIDFAIQQNSNFSNFDLIDFAIAPHSIYTCSIDTLKNALESARKNEMLLHIHVSETNKEVSDCLKKYGKRPVELLSNIGFLGKDINLAHSIWIDDNEQKLIAETNTNITPCTESNLKLASGFTPLKGILEKNINVSLGTDGVSSNNDLSILSEMDFTAKVYKAINLDPTFLPAQEVVKMVTINAAKTLNKENQIGSLEKGKKADIIIINNNTIEALPMYNVYSHLVYNLNGNAVDDVIINGKIVLRNKMLQNINEEELIEKSKFYYNQIKQ